ncbi:MAG: hypothetical protein A2622_02485 [Bdellovibrionales bacterium RIFCSPHIGHO2_01_FULL_40_29]|nr:MAG: hypothetical protein A2622_02485 [Bdellovibrionales bacterium RIFCSPHIGHO2_01_FULL_40_29]OFZ33949.1 MAG: hypothetical protein A3D17_02905 [Bdellovibrionales bacterium RIFCSPHIGHO2_02_FULL_40_15]
MAFHNAHEDYQKMNDQISLNLFQKQLNIRLYQTPHLAAFDITLAFQQYLSHKPNVGLCKNGSSLIESLTPGWLRTHTAMKVKAEKQTWYEFTESLCAETAFVIWSSENEITGEIMYSDKQISEIHDQLAQKRIFSIQIVHEENLKIDNLKPYSVLISRSSIFTKNSSIALLGEKIKAPTTMGQFQDLTTLTSDFQFLTRKHTVSIENLEAKYPDTHAFYFNQFANIPHRLNDRLVFYFPDIPGATLQEYLKLTSDLCFTVAKIPFWTLDMWKNWWKEAESEKLIRGLLVVSLQAFIERPQLIFEIHAAAASIRSRTLWSIST